jgi:hypothetical protein
VAVSEPDTTQFAKTGVVRNEIADAGVAATAIVAVAATIATTIELRPNFRDMRASDLLS